MVLKIDHFVRDLSPEDARALFKKSVVSISLAISSYCNRQCTYCPNSIADRKSHRHFISDGLFFNVLRQLCAIEYSGVLNLHRYNEPLADRDYALARLRDVRVFLPKAVIKIFTNGDNLDRDYLDALAALRVNEINATVHAGPGGKTDFDSLRLEQDRRIAELGLAFGPAPNVVQEDNVRVQVAYHPSGLKMVINAHDFYRVHQDRGTWAFDRGGVIPVHRTYVRTKPCLSQFAEMEIEWDGTLLPCCQIHNDAFPHDDYVLGKLTAESDIFAAWTNAKYVGWRIKMSTTEAKGSPCTTCSYGEPMPDTSAEIIGKLGRMHALLRRATNPAPITAG